MTSIPALRKMVENGWTIANRRQLVQNIGKQAANELSRLSFMDDLGMDVFEHSMIAPELATGKINSIKTTLLKRLGIVEHTPRIKTIYQGHSYCHSHIDRGGNIDFSRLLPDDYINIREFRDSSLPIEKAHFYIDRLYSRKNGDGTSQVQSIVIQSLRDKLTRGRVMLECGTISEYRPCPAGFYYKLGFRFMHKTSNQKMEQWLSRGGKFEEAPKVYGHMYLPRENIIHCLTYGYN